MLTKSDLILILTDMQNKGIDIKNNLMKAVKSDSVSLEVLKFIQENRQLDISAFYTLLRKNYNSKKSPLYKNLVKEEMNEPEDVLTTLAALNLQILLYAKKLDDNKLFLKHSRAEEITFVLNNYYKNYDLIPCLKLLRLIKADLKAFESLKS